MTVFSYPRVRLLMLSSFVAILLGPRFGYASERAQVGLQCVSYGTGPMLECLIDLKRKDGTPIDQAQITLSALMPSMPMAHTIKPVRVVPTGKPGEYRGSLTLEMLGVWSIDIDIAAPMREKVSRNLMVNECKGDLRCAATLAKPGDKSPDHRPAKGHGGH